MHPGCHVDDIIFLIKPIFEEFGFEKGWEILKNVFRSYYGSSCQTKTYLGNQNQRMIADFFDRCSYFMGKDIKEIWIPITVQRYHETVTRRLIYTKLLPLNPKAGDELLLSVYNCPRDLSPGGIHVYYDNNKYKPIISFPKPIKRGDTIGIPIHTVKESETNIGFRVLLSSGAIKEWSNATNPFVYC